MIIILYSNKQSCYVTKSRKELNAIRPSLLGQLLWTWEIKTMNMNIAFIIISVPKESNLKAFIFLLCICWRRRIDSIYITQKLSHVPFHFILFWVHHIVTFTSPICTWTIWSLLRMPRFFLALLVVHKP